MASAEIKNNTGSYGQDGRHLEFRILHPNTAKKQQRRWCRRRRRQISDSHSLRNSQLRVQERSVHVAPTFLSVRARVSSASAAFTYVDEAHAHRLAGKLLHVLRTYGLLLLRQKKVFLPAAADEAELDEMYWLTLTLILGLTFRHASPYFITVDSHSEECFFDKVDFGTKMGLTFEIAEGGFLDIDARIVGPDGKVIYEGEQESSGKFTFAAHMNGAYTYCFSNTKGTMTPKVVMFNMDIGEAPKVTNNEAAPEGDSANTKLEDMIKELSTSLWSVKSEQDYMQVRDRNHRAINENTNFRVVVWSFFEATALVCMTMGQVYYLKRFFEVRRVV